MQDGGLVFKLTMDISGAVREKLAAVGIQVLVEQEDNIGYWSFVFPNIDPNGVTFTIKNLGSKSTGDFTIYQYFYNTAKSEETNIKRQIKAKAWNSCSERKKDAVFTLCILFSLSRIRLGKKRNLFLDSIQKHIIV